MINLNEIEDYLTFKGIFRDRLRKREKKVEREKKGKIESERKK